MKDDFIDQNGELIYDEDTPMSEEVLSLFGSASKRRGGSISGNKTAKLCEYWVGLYKDWFADCAAVSKFYSGNTMENQHQMKVLGLIDHANYMPGRATLERAVDEFVNRFLQPRRLLSIKLKDYEGTPSKKKAQEEKAGMVLHRHFTKVNTRLIDEFKETGDRHVMHGDPVWFFHPEGCGLLPICTQVLTDADAPQNVEDDNFRRWAVADDLQITDVLNGLKAGDKGWSKGIKKALAFYWKEERDAIDPDKYGDATRDPLEMVEMATDFTEEEYESECQSSSEFYDFVNSKLRVFYFCQKDFTDPSNGTPIDYYVVARFRLRENLDGEQCPMPILYKMKGAYSNIKHCMVDFVKDCNLGTKDKTWGTIKGLGHMNFLPDMMQNRLISSLMNNQIDKATPLWEAADITQFKELEKFIRKGYSANGIIPPGLRLVEKYKNGASIQEGLVLIQELKRMVSENAVSHTSDSMPNNSDELRAVAVRRERRDSRAHSNRSAITDRKAEQGLTEIYRRTFDGIWDNSMGSQKDSEIQSIHSDLIAIGVETEWFYPDNLEFNYSMVPGDGDPEARRAANAEMMQGIAFIPEQFRNEILMEWAAIRYGWEVAERWYSPEKQEEYNADQHGDALNKFSSMLNTGQVFPVTPNDIPEIQIPIILNAAKEYGENAIQTGEMTIREMNGLIATGKHVMQMIIRLEELGRKEIAQIFTTELQNLSAMLEEPMNNILKQQGEEEVSLDDQLKIAKSQRDDLKMQNEQLRTQHKIEQDYISNERKDADSQMKQYNSAKNNIRQQQYANNQDANTEIARLRLELDALKESFNK